MRNKLWTTWVVMLATGLTLGMGCTKKEESVTAPSPKAPSAPAERGDSTVTPEAAEEAAAPKETAGEEDPGKEAAALDEDLAGQAQGEGDPNSPSVSGAVDTSKADQWFMDEMRKRFAQSTVLNSLEVKAQSGRLLELKLKLDIGVANQNGDNFFHVITKIPVTKTQGTTITRNLETQSEELQSLKMTFLPIFLVDKFHLALQIDVTTKKGQGFRFQPVQILVDMSGKEPKVLAQNIVGNIPGPQATSDQIKAAWDQLVTMREVALAFGN